jgi:menaquinone-9 beta-reductase
MDACDVLIVGGGPAGSSCAWGLRSSGLRVVVLDKARFPRNKVCGGWITPQVLQALEIDPEDYARGRTCQPITGFRISAMGRRRPISAMARREVQVSYRQAVSYGIRRYEFDDYLLRRSGAEIRQGVSVHRIEPTSDGWTINGDIKARMLVGAGGHFCPVARRLGNGHSPSNSPSHSNVPEPVVAQELEFAMDAAQAKSCPIRPEIPELYFCSDLQGYGWCFRKDNFLNVGLGRLDQHALPRHVSDFMRFLRTTGKLTCDSPEKPAGHAYFLIGRSGREIMADRVLLIGDSAGLAYIQSGEGIRPAVESGLFAANVIRGANGCYTRARLEKYRELTDLWSQTFGHTTLAERMPRNLRNKIGLLCLQTQWFCRHKVVEDWFLHKGTQRSALSIQPA